MRPPHSSREGGGGGAAGYPRGLGHTRMSTRILFTLLGIGFFGLLFYKLGKSALVSRSSSYLSDATSHTVGSPVSVCVSKTWPYHNPLETYDFYGKLGVCTPAEQESAPMTLGQILRGDRLLKSGYEISYGVKQETPKILCTLEADRAVVLNWQDLIDQSYFFEMYVDELPIHQAFGVRIFQKKKLGGKKTLGDREDGVDAKEGEKVQDTEKASQPQQKREYGEEDFEESDYEYRYYLRTHLHFILGYNEGQVVHASLGSEDLNKDFLDITDPPASGKTIEVSFTYTVDWQARPDISPQSRVYRQLSSPFAPVSGDLLSQQPERGDSREVDGSSSGSSSSQEQLQQRSRGSHRGFVDVHWLGILNSFVFTLLIVLLLLVLLMKIVKTDLHNMGFRLADEELAAAGLEEETGWKLLHADVFRTPHHRMPLAGMVGCGAHLLMLVLATIIVGCFIPYLERGELLSCSLLAYFLTSFVAGYISSSTYRKMGGVNWSWNLIVTIVMFALPLFLIWCVLNTIALSYNSTAALPFSTAFLLFACWFFITLPLTVLGGIWGKRRATKAIEGGRAFPCKTNKLAREIPRVRWYNRPRLQALVSGIMPFSGIYIELHYLFVSVWSSNRIYTFYSFLLLAGLLLFVSAAAVSVLLTYMHLNAEDYRWWWNSFLSGGSVSIYFFLHCVYYFFTSTRMHGLLQISFFFGYSLAVSWMLFLMTGCVTFTANFLFVKYIYSRIKCD